MNRPAPDHDPTAEALVDMARGVRDLHPGLDEATRAELVELRHTAERVRAAHPDPARIDTAVVDAPATLAEAVVADPGPRRARRLAPTALGRWTPALVAAVLVLVVGLVAWLDRDDDSFAPLEVAAQAGTELDAGLRVIEVDGGTDFELRVDGLTDLRYDVWVRDLTGERVWIGSFQGDPAGTLRFSTDLAAAELERFWVTDPDDTAVLGSDV